MGYCIQYTQGIALKTELQESKHTRKGRIQICILLMVIVFFLVAASMGMTAEFLIPGDREVTKAAFIELVQDVENGENVKTAITTFCKEVISGADAAQGADIH